MAWSGSDNDNSKKRDPWGGRHRQQTPPDLDVLLRKFKNQLKALFTNKDDGNHGAGFKFSDQQKPKWLIGLIILGLVAIWALSGIFIVSPPERAVILRFGKYVETLGPGMHWIPRIFESKYIVNVQRVDNFTYQSEMLTKDENIVSVTISVQYRVDNARDYLFNVVYPGASLQQATASALRQVVGHTTLDGILTMERMQAREQITQQLQELLTRYQSGIVATDVTLQSVRPPEAVTAAFDDVVKAREDQQSYINQATAYKNQVWANANGQVARVLQEANAARQSLVLDAQAATVSYLAVLPQYQKSPEVTRERLYLSTIQSILTHTTKILVDVTGGNSNIMYLPLDKILPQIDKKFESESKQAAAETTEETNAQPEETFLSRPVYPTRGGS